MRIIPFEYHGIVGTANVSGSIVFVHWNGVRGHLRSLAWCMDDAFFNVVQRAIASHSVPV
jgi:hypothetical protein